MALSHSDDLLSTFGKAAHDILDDYWQDALICSGGFVANGDIMMNRHETV